MKRIRWTDRARADKDEIWFSIAVNNVAAADRVSDRIDELLKKLRRFPLIGMEREELRPGLRSFPCGDCLVFYRVMPHELVIVRVVYRGRNFDTLEYPE